MHAAFPSDDPQEHNSPTSASDLTGDLQAFGSASAFDYSVRAAPRGVLGDSGTKRFWASRIQHNIGAEYPRQLLALLPAANRNYETCACGACNLDSQKPNGTKTQHRNSFAGSESRLPHSPNSYGAWFRECREIVRLAGRKTQTRTNGHVHIFRQGPIRVQPQKRDPFADGVLMTQAPEALATGYDAMTRYPVAYLQGIHRRSTVDHLTRELMAENDRCDATCNWMWRLGRHVLWAVYVLRQIGAADSDPSDA